MQDNNACRKLISDVLTDPIFQGVIRLFVLLYWKSERYVRYFLSVVEIKDNINKFKQTTKVRCWFKYNKTNAILLKSRKR